MIPPVLLLVPIFDPPLVFFSRLRRAKTPLPPPGKDHLSHRLHALGFPRRETVLVCWLIASSAGMAAVFLTQAPVAAAYCFAVLLALGAIYWIWWFERGSVSTS